MFHALGFTVANIFGCVIFGAIGLSAFIYGKRMTLWRPMLIGGALMGYPYLISGTLSIYLIGVALTIALYFWRE